MSQKAHDVSILETKLARPNKLRKGTFSCWACKRRKIRCKPGQSSDGACLRCERHGAACVSQEKDDPAGRETEACDFEDQLDYLEDLIQKVARSKSRSHGLAQPNITHHGQVRKRLTANPSSIKPMRSCDLEKIHRVQSSPSRIKLDESLPVRLDCLSNFLNNLMPSEHDTAMILEGNRSPLARLLQPMRIMQSSVPRARRLEWIAEKPRANAHPAVLARKLLQLAIGLLQMTVSPNERHDLNINGSIRDNIRRFTEGARHVTAQDILVNSLDGLEALTLEGFLHIIMGNPDDARSDFQRGLKIAQKLGLPSTQQLEEHHREESIWFRLNNLDRSLALRLGLPHAVFDNNFASDSAPATDIPRGRLSRVHAMVAGRIITRNLHMLRQQRCTYEEADAYDHFRETHELNEHMKYVSQLLPTEWWLQPIRIEGQSDLETQENASRITAQLEHHHLLLLLYQPYVMSDCYRGRGNTAEKIGELHSKITAISASRQILTSFQLLSGVEHLPTIYKNLEHKGFLASLTILLIHLGEHQASAPSALEHQRTQDLQVLIPAIECLERLARLTDDPSALDRIGTLRRLMLMEDDAAFGGSYSIESAGVRRIELVQEFNTLGFETPFFGRIYVKRLDTPADDNIGTRHYES